jgi:nucleotidyltransferase/DNA polymerase involved in DNA repair
VLDNDPRQIESFVQGKKLRKIPGIGPVNEYYLKGLGIETGKDILDNLDVLTICFSKLSTEFFVSAAIGCGSIEHEFKERKSVGKSETFKTTEDLKFLEERLKSLCEEVSVELQELGFMSINVVMSYQTHNFEKRDKTFNLLKYTDKSDELYEPLITFLKSIKTKLRLLGVKCTSLLKS